MKKQFKTESKRLMDLMINSIYTNKENAYISYSEALDLLNSERIEKILKK